MKSWLKILMIPACLIILTGSLGLINGDHDLRTNEILDKLNIFRTKYRQQKIHLHTDKDIYQAGETVWLKAYLVEASSMLPDSVGKEIYVDLIDFNNQHVRSIILRNKNGFSHGDLLLSDTLMQGNYQLRSYTNWMRNFESDFFYNKTIVVKNPNYENVVTRNRLKEIKKYNRKYNHSESTRTVQFFPEGGNLVAGFQCKVAFKAENNLGQSVNIQGVLFDDKSNQITTFESVHEGMGVFAFTPGHDRKYTAKIKYSDGENAKFALPKVMAQGIVMSVDPFAGEDVKLTIRSNRPPSEDVTFKEIIVVAQSRGVVHFVSKEVLNDAPVVLSIPKKSLPGGIVQITLFDGRNEPQCERLVFVDPVKELDACRISLTEHSKGDSIFYQVQLTKPNGMPVVGNLSLAVSESLGDSENSGNIFTDLLFTSDLKGHIDNPSYYFNKAEPDAKNHLDLVMLVNGWRRFVWKEILADRFPKIRYSPAEGISVDGKITRDHFGIPIFNSKVKLTIMNSYNDQFETYTNKKGQFSFPNLDYEDSIDVKIEAFKPLGGKGVQIVLTDTAVPEISTKTFAAVQNEEFDKAKLKANNRRENLRLKGLYKKPEASNDIPKIHETPRDVINVGPDASEYSNILQYMTGKVAGVQITGNRVIIRGMSTLYGSTDPLYLMDGVPIDAGSVSAINPSDIATIEVLKGPDASIYGVQGSNGVIGFYSRRGTFMKRGVIEFGMLGYYKAREFYVPAYNSWNYKPTSYNIPRTLYWKPYIVTDSTGTATFKFKNRLNITKSRTTIEGITLTGDLIHYKK